MDKQRPRIGVGVMVCQNNKILLGKRTGALATGTWAFPGGHLEIGESVEACAARELLEETGLKIISSRLGPWVADIIDQDKHYVTLFVYVTAFEGTLELLEPHKCEGWHWYSPEVFPEPLFPSIQSLIKKIGRDNLLSFT